MYVFLPPANEVWGKVIFSVACVKNSVHRGGTSSGTPQVGTPNPPGQVPPWSHTPWAFTPLGMYTPHRYTPGQVHPPGRYTPRTSTCWEIWATSGRYASYWNAFLLHMCVILFTGGGLASQHALGRGGWLPRMHWEKRAVCILLECFLVDYSYIRTILKQKCTQERQ